MTASPHSDGGLAAFALRLYVAGSGPNSTAALHNLRAFLVRHQELAVELEVIDVLQEPLRGFADGIVVTPTLVRSRPAPERRIIGSLREPLTLLAALDLGKA